MGKGKGKSKGNPFELIPLGDGEPPVLRVPLFTPATARQHLLEQHAIGTTPDQPDVLLASIHQADHLAAGIGGRPLHVRHYHTAEVKPREDDDA